MGARSFVLANLFCSIAIVRLPVGAVPIVDDVVFAGFSAVVLGSCGNPSRHVVSVAGAPHQTVFRSTAGAKSLARPHLPTYGFCGCYVVRCVIELLPGVIAGFGPVEIGFQLKQP